MPGISVVTLPPDNSIANLKKVFSTLKYNERYVSKIVDDGVNYFIGHCAYKEYPIRSYKYSKYTIVIEGIIYNYPLEIWQNELEILAHTLEMRNNRTEALQDWLNTHEGDYVIVVAIGRKVYIVNDIFGRLPLYYHASEKMIAITRDPHLFSLMGLTESIDRLGMAMMLLFNHTIGKRTIWENVQYMRGGTLLEIDLLESILKTSSVILYNFQDLIKKGITNRRIANLAELFGKAASDRRNNTGINVLGLSGGLDSRLVAAALKPFSTVGVTRLREGEKEKSEIPIAQNVASIIPSLSWDIIQTDKATLNDYEELLMMKEGMNSLEMSFKVPYLNVLRKRYGAGIHYFTGDGGDRLKPHLPLFGKIDSQKKLIRHILNKHAAVKISTVSKLLNMSSSEIYDSLRHSVESYPEDTYDYKYIHFQIYESAFKYVFEGEDYNRYYFWTVTPFYQREFFTEAMSIPDREKQYYKLYSKVIEKLSPEMLYIRNHDDAATITSGKLIYKMVVKEIIKTIVNKNARTKIKNTIGKKISSGSLLADSDCIVDNMKNSVLIKKGLVSEYELNNVLSDNKLNSIPWIWRVVTMLYSAR